MTKIQHRNEWCSGVRNRWEENLYSAWPAFGRRKAFVLRYSPQGQCEKENFTNLELQEVAAAKLNCVGYFWQDAGLSARDRG